MKTPDNYFIPGGIVQGRVQTGNAVPVFVSKALSKQLMKMFTHKELTGYLGDGVKGIKSVYLNKVIFSP